MANSILSEDDEPEDIDTTTAAILAKLVCRYGTKAVLRTLAQVCSQRGEEIADTEPIFSAEWRAFADAVETLANSRAGLR